MMPVLFAVSCQTSKNKPILSEDNPISYHKNLSGNETFSAVGPNEPIVKYLDSISSPVPDELERVAVEVFFDLTTVIMRFSMPCYPCMVTENNIHYSNGWTETYDPKASSSCEILWDKEARYARMWVESQTPARIVVRVRAAIADPDGRIAHSDIPSGSPYGEGDWTDEWYYIYPDGTHTRHVRIYTGLAESSLLVTNEMFDGYDATREIPPRVVHEFQEEFIFGQNGHLPTDDIETEAFTLIKLDGRSKTVSFDPYPYDFGEFTIAAIKVINLKSKLRPFVISIPEGVQHEPYRPEGELPNVFQTWPANPEPDRGYSTSLGHILNWWHYRRTDNILEQVYLSGMTDDSEPADELIPLAWSWLDAPQLKMQGLEPEYKSKIYDQAQKAYLIPGKGARNIKFSLIESGRKNQFIRNPAFIIENWGADSPADIILNGKIMEPGKDVRIGHEKTSIGTNLVLWFNYRSGETSTFEILTKDEI